MRTSTGCDRKRGRLDAKTICNQVAKARVTQDGLGGFCHRLHAVLSLDNAFGSRNRQRGGEIDGKAASIESAATADACVAALEIAEYGSSIKKS